MNDLKFKDDDIFNLNQTFAKEDYYVRKRISRDSSRRSRSTSRRKHRYRSSSSRATSVTSEQEKSPKKDSKKRKKKEKKKRKNKKERSKSKKSKKSKSERHSLTESRSENCSNKESDENTENDRKSVKSQISLVREKSNSLEKNSDVFDDRSPSPRKKSSRHRDRSKKESGSNEKREKYLKHEKRKYSNENRETLVHGDNKNYSSIDNLRRSSYYREHSKYSEEMNTNSHYIPNQSARCLKRDFDNYPDKADIYYSRDHNRNKYHHLGKDLSSNTDLPPGYSYSSTAPYKRYNHHYYNSQAQFDATRMSASTVFQRSPSFPVPTLNDTPINQYQNIPPNEYYMHPNRVNNLKMPVYWKANNRHHENTSREDQYESKNSIKSASETNSFNETENQMLKDHFGNNDLSEEALKKNTTDLENKDKTDKPEGASTEKNNRSPQEDLLALKSDIQKQLKEKLFDCEKFLNLFEIAGFDGESETDKDIPKPVKVTNKNKKTKKRRRSISATDNSVDSPVLSPDSVHSGKSRSPVQKSSPRFKIKSKHSSKTKSKMKKFFRSKISTKKPKSKKVKSNVINLSDFLLEEGMGDIVRRSDRIKTIEVIKQHHNELKIAEKIKQHITHQPDTSPDDNQCENSLNSPDYAVDQSLSSKLKNRRASEISEVSLRAPNTSLSPINIATNMDIDASNKTVLVNRNNGLFNSPNSNSPNSMKMDSPRALKKCLPNKIVSEKIQNQRIGESFKNIVNEIQNNNNFTEPPIARDYERIEENIYLCKRVRKTKSSQEAKKMVCDCSTSQQERSLGIPACGDDCLNRLLMIECGARCPCGEFCTNRNFKTKNNASVQPFRTEFKGWGLRTLSELKTNTFLIEYIGEVIDIQRFKKRSEKYAAQNNEHFYFMSLHNDLFIDATQKGNISRYFNHSCDPNCETQKWTVNGELRIGFFTRRPVSANEELTFDYQFQTVGKKQQKCYCGSEKCRGFLGVSSNYNQNSQQISNGALDHIWERSSDDSTDDNNDLATTEDDSETEEDNDNIKQSNRLGADTELEISTAPNINEVSQTKIRKEKKMKKTEPKDYDLNDQINSIKSLTNKESVLKLCRLMFRTENLESRIDILNLLLNAKSEISLRLFMDYYGLKLLCIWMCDIDSPCSGYLSVLLIECKLKIIQVLSKMAIKNRTVLEEFKLLNIVKRWSEHGKFHDTKVTINCETDQSNVIKSLLDELVDRVSEASINEQNELIGILNEKSSKLYEVWNSLKVDFKIPKKQRIEERKEHERELNLAYNSSTEQTSTSTEKSNVEKFSRENIYKRNKLDQGLNNNDRMYSKNYYQKFPCYNSNQYSPSQYQQTQQPNYQTKPQTTALSKEQRRQLFEQRVREQEEAEAAAIANTTSQSNDSVDRNKKMRWYFDTNAYQWILIPENSVENNNLMQPTQFESVNPTKEANSNSESLGLVTAPSLTNSNSAEDLQFNDLQKPVEKCASNQEEVKESLESKIRKYLLAGSVSPTSSSLLKKSGLSPTPVNKLSISSSSITNDGEKRKLVTELPKHWKHKTNEKGLTYYYNVKTQKSQWNFPESETTANSKVIKTETSLVNTNTEISKVYKDQFRDKISKLVVNLLKPYLNEKCQAGRIKNTEDFKHLARKFTHTIIEKEMSRTSNLEELELDKRVKMKSAEYVTNYMAKFNISGYSRKQDV